MAVEVRIPELGESITDGEIVRWLKQDGDVVEVDEPVLELETDKATMEIPAPASGRLEIVERQGATVRVGTVVARIDEGAAEPAARAKAAGRPAAGAPRVSRPGPSAETRLAPPDGARKRERPVGPRPDVGEPPGRDADRDEPLRTGTAAGAGEEGPAAEPGEGMRRQVAEIAAERIESPPEEGEPAAEAPQAVAPAPGPRPAPDAEGEMVERKPMSRLRRRIAERLVEAQRTAAILTTVNEIDCSRLLAARRRHREQFRERHGVDLGLVSLFGRACMLALADVPILNARIDGDDIVYHRHVHLGIAVSTPRGLVVPVIRAADRLSLAELERAIEDLARLARAAKLTPDHLARGTFTITNGGVFGSLLSTPILTPPQSGILGMHKIEERPVAVDGQVVIRPMMYVALSYDHRLVDGEQAVTFLVRVKERLEDPVRMLLEV